MIDLGKVAQGAILRRDDEQKQAIFRETVFDLDLNPLAPMVRCEKCKREIVAEEAYKGLAHDLMEVYDLHMLATMMVFHVNWNCLDAAGGQW